MSRWKELRIERIDALPKDLAKGNYEWRYFSNSRHGWESAHQELWEILSDAVKMHYGAMTPLVYQYREGELKKVSHADRMTKWWNTSENVWKQVDTYNTLLGYLSSEEPLYVFNGPAVGGKDIGGGGSRSAVTAGWFDDKKSADIPPERKVE